MANNLDVIIRKMCWANKEEDAITDIVETFYDGRNMLEVFVNNKLKIKLSRNKFLNRPYEFMRNYTDADLTGVIRNPIDYKTYSPFLITIVHRVKIIAIRLVHDRKMLSLLLLDDTIESPVKEEIMKILAVEVQK